MSPRRPARGGPGERRLTIFYTAEVHGTPEPCGCTSDPLGDVARYAALVRTAARKGPVLLVDAGGLSFPESSTRQGEAGERGARDVPGRGAGPHRPAVRRRPGRDRRHAGHRGGGRPGAASRQHLARARTSTPSRLETVGGVRVGIIGVADPALASGLGATGEDPVAAAKREAAALRSKGAELVIALAPVEKPLARRIARDAAVDLVVLGRQVGQGMDRAEKVGNAFLVASADELQRVGRIDIVWRGKGPLVDAGGPEAAALRRVEIDQAIARIDDELKAWAARQRRRSRRSSPASAPSATALVAERGSWTRPGRRPTARTSRTA